MINITFDELKIPKELFSQEEIKKLATQEVQATITRTTSEIEQGRDADGKSLKAYSLSYKKQREAEGLSTRTNLRRKGTLLGSRQALNIDKGAEGLFSGTHYSRQSNAALAGDLESRGFVNWHAFGKKDIERIEKVVGKQIDEKLNKLIEIKKRT